MENDESEKNTVQESRKKNTRSRWKSFVHFISGSMRLFYNVLGCVEVSEQDESKNGLDREIQTKKKLN